MAKLIKNRQLVPDGWKLLNGNLEWLRRPAEDGLLPDFPQGDIIVPLTLWQMRSEDLIDRSEDPRFFGGGLGIWLDSHEDAAGIALELARFKVVAVNLPHFADGRGYSIARLLRERHGYRGELRAIGDVLRDQLYYLARCGFDAFALRADQDPEQALAALDDFSEAYQASVERPEPLFQRRLAVAPQSKAA